MSARDSLPADGREAARAIVPLVLLLAAAAIHETRLFVLVALVGGVAVAVSRAAPVRWAWAATIPVALSLVWELLPLPRADLLGRDCAAILSPPAAWRLAEAAVVLGAAAVLVRLLRARPGELGLRLPARPVVNLSVATFLVLGPLALLLGAWLGRPFFGPFALDLSQPAALVPGLIFALSNATLEEVAYRGVLLRWSARLIGLAPAVVAQAVVFGVAHGGPGFVGSPLPVIAAMVAGGLLAGFLAVRTRSLLLPIAAHAALDLPLYAYLACPG